MTTDEEAEAFLEQDLSDLDFSQLKPAKFEFQPKARDLQDLGAAPGNRLEALIGNRKGRHSIRTNDQWRICFVWAKEGPTDVEIVGYH
jgi:proteic killer suppression protein